MTVPSWDPLKPITDSLLASADMRADFNSIAWSLWGRNLAANGEMLFWSGGDTAAPDYYRLEGSGAAILRTGAGGSDTRPGYVDRWCARVTAGGGAAAQFIQNILNATSFALIQQAFRSTPFATGSWVYCTSLNGARAAINDGIGISYGNYHTGSGWEFLAHPRVLNSAATKLEGFIDVSAGVTAYISGFIFVIGPVVPQTFMPSVIQRGMLVFIQQGTLFTGTTIGGVRFYAQRPMMLAETSLALGTASAGAPVIVDINKNLTSAYTTKPTVAIAAVTGNAIPDGVYSTRCVARGQYVTADIDQVGTGGSPGVDLTVQVGVLVYTRPLEARLGTTEISS